MGVVYWVGSFSGSAVAPEMFGYTLIKHDSLTASTTVHVNIL